MKKTTTIKKPAGRILADGTYNVLLEVEDEAAELNSAKNIIMR